MKPQRFTAAFLTVCLAIISSSLQPAKAESLKVVAKGLNNARGLTVGSDGSIYVTESGVGGDGKCMPSPSVGGQLLCAGNSGAVTKITPDGKQNQIITGLPSLALEDDQIEAAGPQDLKFDAFGNAYLLVGMAGNPGHRDAQLNAAGGNQIPPDQVVDSPGLGRLYKFDRQAGAWFSIADMPPYELAKNPDQGDVISNPYALTLIGNTAYIVDAGGNSLYRVGLDGSSLQAIGLPRQILKNPIFPKPQPGEVLPPGAPPPGQEPKEIPIQSVPTGIAVGPDGALYVSEFTGFPYPEGKARIFRIDRDGKPEVYAEGFTQIGDVEFDKQGNMYVLQIADQSLWKGKLDSSLIKVAPDGKRTTVVKAGEGLVAATALDIGPDGAIYITNKGITPGTGEVVKITGQ